MKQTVIPGIGGVLTGELIVDLFAGGGGASSGIESALGRSPDIAINHDPHAVQMHEANHPATEHYCESVYDVDPRKATGGQPVGLLWLSPDCRHFSRAKGGAPVSPSVRALAWIGLRWAKHARPRVVCLENVPEFVTWGPLGKDGKPNPDRIGETFAAFKREWQRYGYTVEHRVLVAADYGAPTTRKRLFLVARCDGEPITWPEPTHGKHGKPRPWRAAAECIDWSLPCPSIFERKRPLATATCRRIARGIARYVLQGKPFLVRTDMHLSNAGCVYDPADPLRTATSSGGHGVVSPVMLRMGHGDKQWNGVGEPLTTVTAQGNHHALVAPTLVQTGYGEREGQAPRCLDLQVPLGTATAGGCKHGLVAAFLERHFGTGDKIVLGKPMTDPVPTVTARDHHAVVAGNLIQIGQRHERGDAPLDAPMGTVMPTQRAAVVAAFLVQYYSQGTTDQPLTEPMATIVTRARHGLVTVTIDGAEYALVDIGMRMLEPHELAAAQGFPPSYVLTGTKSQRIARIGNSVCPPLAAAIVGANLVPRLLGVA
jgi:DNA (cytosine-5)-methyltransferase 1